MRNIEQVEKYYCEYCGKECNHTGHIVPSLEDITKYGRGGIGNVVLGAVMITKIQPKQVDICPTYQNKIADMLDNIIKENNRKIIRKSEDYDFSRYY